ncbi:MAG: LLM class F420-dependent oxidoreductase [Acidobacteriota bacterium]|nr:LLM class F420-dependent oxidoreductase [Acidobacteriota bacterium]
MKLGLMLGYWQAGPPPNLVELCVDAEKLGFDCVFTAETWGSDVFTPLAWIGAHTSKIRLGTGIAQISARTPASTAMHAMTLDHLSGGRVILGLGVSGPQVVEGWYGQPFAKPVARTREYVSIIKKILARDEPVTNHGEWYPMPYTDHGSWEMGKPLKTILHPLRSDMPIVLGAEGPNNVALSAELCDGWLPLYYSPYSPEIYEDAIAARHDNFEIFYPSRVVVTDDVEAGLAGLKPALAFYIGGMGSKKRNFHRELVARMGYEEESFKIQDLFMSGQRDEATAAVPDKFVDDISLVGPPERIKDRLSAWEESPVTHLLVSAKDGESLRNMAELLS